jgi:hypothetical protein
VETGESVVLMPHTGTGQTKGLPKVRNMRKLVGVLLSGALVLGACSDGGDGGPDPADDPKGALIEAFKDLSEGDGVSMNLSIDSDEASLQALVAEDGTDLPEETAGLILDSSLTFGANNATDPAEVQMEILFELGGEEAAAIVVDGYDLYAHADVRGMLETFGEDPAVVDQQLASIPPGFEFVEQAVDNEWIHLTGLEQLMQQAEQSGQAAPNISEQQQEILNQFSQALEENSEVTEGDEDGPGTHLEASVDVKGFAQAFEEIAGELQGISGGTMGQIPSGTEDLPEGDFIIDTWVEDGTLTQVRVDVLKNAEVFAESDPVPEGVEEFGIVLGIEEFDGEVDTPDDAVEVSFEQIMGALFGAMSGGMESGSSEVQSEAGGGGTTDVCDAVAELPEDQQQAYKDICPDL